MLVTALMVSSLILFFEFLYVLLQEVLGYDLEWQARHTTAGYLLALSEHFAIMGDLGYCFVVLLDVSYTLSKCDPP